jgi:hypothetical protein
MATGDNTTMFIGNFPINVLLSLVVTIINNRVTTTRHRCRSWRAVATHYRHLPIPSICKLCRCAFVEPNDTNRRVSNCSAMVAARRRRRTRAATTTRHRPRISCSKARLAARRCIFYILFFALCRERKFFFLHARYNSFNAASGPLPDGNTANNSAYQSTSLQVSCFFF